MKCQGCGKLLGKSYLRIWKWDNECVWIKSVMPKDKIRSAKYEYGTYHFQCLSKIVKLSQAEKCI